MKMSKNRFKIETVTTYITDESASCGEFDRHEDGKTYTFEKLSDVVDYIVREAKDGFACNDSDRFDSFQCAWNTNYKNGEEYRDSFHILFGTNVDAELNRQALRIAVCNKLKRLDMNVDSFLRGY